MHEKRRSWRRRRLGSPLLPSQPPSGVTAEGGGKTNLKEPLIPFSQSLLNGEDEFGLETAK